MFFFCFHTNKCNKIVLEQTRRTSNSKTLIIKIDFASFYKSELLTKSSRFYNKTNRKT